MYLSAVLDLGVILALAGILWLPFTLDPLKGDVATCSFPAPLSDNLAA